MAQSANKARVLPDLAAQMAQMQETLARLSEENEALKAQAQSSHTVREPRVYVGPYTPKKGKDAGKTVQRLFVDGGGLFFPVILKQDPCKVILEHLDVVKAYAKNGK